MLKTLTSYLVLATWDVSLLPILSDLIPHPLWLQFYKILIAQLPSVVFQQFLEIAQFPQILLSHRQTGSCAPIFKTTLDAFITILIIKPMRGTISLIYFWNRTLHVSDSFSVHRQDSSTVYAAIGICHTGYADCLLASSQHNLYDIYLLLCIQY